MDNKNNQQPSPENEAWLNELIERIGDEKLVSDEHAPNSADLTSADELDLDRILSENWDTAANTAQSSKKAGTSGSYTRKETPIYGDDAEPEQEYEEPAPVRKGRPKSKKGTGLMGIPHLLATLVWLALIVAIGVSLGRVIWVCTADLMAFGKEDQEVTITITDEDNLSSVAKKLSDANLIRYPSLFKTFAQVTGKVDRISVGTFTLNAHLDYNAMINAMGSHASAREEVEVTFPEGYNCAQIFKLLEEKKVCTVQELEEYAANGKLDDYWFLEGVPRGSRYCLEGYLAPDTYKFYTNDEPERVLEKLLDEFEDRFTEIMLEDLAALQNRYADALAANGYGSDYISAHPLTLHNVITLASMIEKETSNDTEGYDIASVFFNRLTDPTDYPFLDSDATVYYAIGDYFTDKKELTAEDLAFDSPYNTRNSQGLPPGPICNSGVQSIYAALDPSSTDCYYFVYSTKAEKHLFSTTYDEHLKKVAELEG